MYLGAMGDETVVLQEFSTPPEWNSGLNDSLGLLPIVGVLVLLFLASASKGK